jgi:hypothetical protein
VIAVLGMHRSGTSATVGTIQQYGFHVGPVSGANRFNARGNRELRALSRLHDEMLGRSGGSWWQPPKGPVSTAPDDRRDRDEALATIAGERAAVKDPRMLLLLDFWREIEPMWIGVYRNPVAVRASLERRAQQGGGPLLDGAGWEALWCHYNRNLLGELERAPFPLVDFDRPAELDTQVRAALAFYGLESDVQTTFFDEHLVNERADAGWRDEVLSVESVELWDRLVDYASGGPTAVARS